MSNTHVKIGEDTVWPGICLRDLEWDLRYGKLDDVSRQRMLAASVVSAYVKLVRLPQKKRNQICEALKDAEARKVAPELLFYER